MRWVPFYAIALTVALFTIVPSADAGSRTDRSRDTAAREQAHAEFRALFARVPRPAHTRTARTRTTRTSHARTDGRQAWEEFRALFKRLPRPEHKRETRTRSR